MLNLRNACVLFIIAKRHPVRNSQFMKATRDVHDLFQEESFKIRNNQQLLPHTAIMERVCACLKVSPSTVRRTLKEFETSNSPGKKSFSIVTVKVKYNVICHKK
jgi:histidinol phosphatase-like enzyme